MFKMSWVRIPTPYTGWTYLKKMSNSIVALDVNYCGDSMGNLTHFLNGLGINCHHTMLSFECSVTRKNCQMSIKDAQK